MNGTRKCSVDDCDRQFIARGWCHMHYKRWRKWGSPTGAAPQYSMVEQFASRTRDSTFSHGRPVVCIDLSHGARGETLTKQEIKVEDIRKGDLIRVEFPGAVTIAAIEYNAAYDTDPNRWEPKGDYYLLERKFEPYWGMVIGLKIDPASRAVYIPNGKNDAQPWLSDTGWECSEWAEEKLKNGWTVIEPPKDEKE